MLMGRTKGLATFVLAGSAALLIGCYPHNQGLIPQAPSARASRQQRVSYYNQYRPLQFLHSRINEPLMYGALPTAWLGAPLLANGDEVHSLNELEPALNRGTELSTCARLVEEIHHTRVLLGTFFGILAAGGAGVVLYSALNSSLPTFLAGTTMFAVGGLTIPIGILATEPRRQRLTNRGFVLYEPLLRERLALEPEGVVPNRPVGGTEPCR